MPSEPSESAVRQSRDLLTIERWCIEGASSMQLPFYRYWPGRLERQQAERHATFYVGSAMHRDGLDLYFEIPLDAKESGKRLDMLAVDHQRDMMIACEAKAFVDLDIAAMTSDVRRLRRFRPEPDPMEFYDYLGLPQPISSFASIPRYGLILALTWRARVAAWWGQKRLHASLPVETGEVGNWKPHPEDVRNLIAAIEGAAPGGPVRRGFATIGKQLGAKDGGFEEQFLLFATFPLSG